MDCQREAFSVIAEVVPEGEPGEAWPYCYHCADERIQNEEGVREYPLEAYYRDSLYGPQVSEITDEYGKLYLMEQGQGSNEDAWVEAENPQDPNRPNAYISTREVE